MISRFVPKIIPVVIRPINPPITADAMGVQDILSPRQTVLPKANVTGAACSCARMNFTSNCVLGKTSKFIDLGLSPRHTQDQLKSVIVPDTRAGALTDNSNKITSSHGIADVTGDRVSEAKAYSDYINNSEF